MDSSKTKIKAVFFDIDDTLYHFSDATNYGMNAVCAYAQENLSVSSQQMLDAIDQAKRKIGDRLGNDNATFHNRLIRFQNALEILGLPSVSHAREMCDRYWNTVLAHAVPEPGIETLLKTLKDQGIYLGIGSDMTAYMQARKLEKLQLAEYFDTVITSEEAGRDKPSLEIFHLCIEKSGRLPQECLFIGDHPRKDYQGAVRAGMHALCYVKYSQKRALDVPEKFQIHTFLDLNIGTLPLSGL